MIYVVQIKVGFDEVANRPKFIRRLMIGTGQHNKEKNEIAGYVFFDPSDEGLYNKPGFEPIKHMVMPCPPKPGPHGEEGEGVIQTLLR